MRVSCKKSLSLLSLILVGFVGAAHAKTYEVYVKRVGPNMYETKEGLNIRTIRCKHVTEGERATLDYEWASYDNKLIFENGESCAVTKSLPKSNPKSGG